MSFYVLNQFYPNTLGKPRFPYDPSFSFTILFFVNILGPNKKTRVRKITKLLFGGEPAGFPKPTKNYN